MAEIFAVKDCTLIAIATGKRAQTLRELRDRLETIHPGCIYYHFWGGLLHPRFADPEYQNDFASWAYHGLNDRRTAEKLGIIDPTLFSDEEALRRELIEVIEERLDESELIPWSKADEQFNFIRSRLVVFDTKIRIQEAVELQQVVRRLPASAVFYHFIDARRRTPGSQNDLSFWLLSFGDRYSAIIQDLNDIDPYFASLPELKAQISSVLDKHLS
jgi:hypothetical protein